MPSPIITLPEVDEVQVTILMDNTVDLLAASTPVANRMRVKLTSPRPQPRAEHGFSALIEVRLGEVRGTVLFDTGVTPCGVLNNMDALGVEAGVIQAIVLSHGHFDHTTGLPALVERLGPRGTPVVFHPDACLERKYVEPDGAEMLMPLSPLAGLPREYARLIEQAAPSTLVNGMVLISGEVARTTDFEKGFLGSYAMRDGVWQPDPWTRDDQCVAANVRGKGLVIVAGCSHAGIINTIRHVQRLTGVTPVHALLGGLHLTGSGRESIIARTVSALCDISPRYIIPGHCTGWAALHQIASAMPEAFVPNYVGTRYVLN